MTTGDKHITTGDKISDLMRKHGFTRDFIASYLDVHVNTLKGYLADDRLPDTKSMYLLAILFEVSMEELLETQDMMFEVIDAKMRMDSWLEKQ